jgi:ATP-binding cassette subfamily B protein
MKFFSQHDQMDCGPACLAMITSFYGKNFPLGYLRDRCYLTREGVSLLSITEAAKSIGLKAAPKKLSLSKLIKEPDLLPCILHWNKNHFVVLKKIRKNWFTGKLRFEVADPGHGLISLSREKFENSWVAEDEKGIALLLAPTNDFYDIPVPTEEKVNLKYLIRYLLPYKRQMSWLFFLLFLGTLTTLAFPILTQILIDDGVVKKDLGIIAYILLAQLAFFAGNIVFGIFRNWISLTVGTKINIQIISEFLKKALSLPIRFFDTKMLGDFSQRIQDHERIENFLASQSILSIFSVITFSVFFGVLWYYDYRILIVYSILTAGSLIWSIYWLRKRKIFDYIKFQQRSENQQSIYEIMNGVPEMKLNQFEEYKRTEWELLQQKLFRTNVRILKNDQIQLSGFDFINQLKNIVVTFLAAAYVVQGHMTLGALLSVSYIIGQMNLPINQLIGFFRSLQDARLSLSRLIDVQNHQEEEKEDQVRLTDEGRRRVSAGERGIFINNLSFQYEGPKSPYVLRDLNFFIPEGKVTAIVGASGSGKTTLMKILLRFYDPTGGSVFYNGKEITSLSPKSLREKCGVVLQDGFIFSDTIERNIKMGDREPGDARLKHATHLANLSGFIDELPLGYATKVGATGNGLSGGQKQRILIARAIYKDPSYLFLDEATSALDAENEKIIQHNLQRFFKGKTVLIIAHRLSTVKGADQIIVLKNGQIVEQGQHEDLVALKEEYFKLVKNQLELGG